MDPNTKDAGRLAARLLQLKALKYELPEVLPPRFLQHVIRCSFVATMKRFDEDATGSFETDPLWQLG